MIDKEQIDIIEKAVTGLVLRAAKPVFGALGAVVPPFDDEDDGTVALTTDRTTSLPSPPT